MTVLFGTVEYFEREIMNYLDENQFSGETDYHLSIITARLEYEILHDFVCDEQIRVECLNNLKNATDILSLCK
ncbi:hypothetical protein [Bacillus sp. Marseille-P3661]|uniref:hypothetical protein n=1 Tax=Bacillus sp. Marseille-P3661 TaxID=1936234 RepID=UPI000C83E917|nr:hypothetical protein [Bacillus sp. Marseille-P3661]